MKLVSNTPINLSMNAENNANNVYVVWTNQTTAGPEDILFKRSTGW